MKSFTLHSQAEVNLPFYKKKGPLFLTIFSGIGAFLSTFYMIIAFSEGLHPHTIISTSLFLLSVFFVAKGIHLLQNPVLIMQKKRQKKEIVKLQVETIQSTTHSTKTAEGDNNAGQGQALQQEIELPALIDEIPMANQILPIKNVTEISNAVVQSQALESMQKDLNKEALTQQHVTESSNTPPILPVVVNPILVTKTEAAQNSIRAEVMIDVSKAQIESKSELKDTRSSTESNQEKFIVGKRAIETSATNTEIKSQPAATKEISSANSIIISTATPTKTFITTGKTMDIAASKPLQSHLLNMLTKFVSKVIEGVSKILHGLISSKEPAATPQISAPVQHSAKTITPTPS